MNDCQASRIGRWFHGYVSRFEVEGHLPPMQQLKLDHSVRVGEAAEAIACEEGWSVGDVRLAGVTGLLHDVGRFSQFAEFGTFADRHSVDHAARGGQILADEGVVAELAPALAVAVDHAVRYHNRLTVPADAPGGSLPLVRLVRDADKLDIYRVVLEAVTSGAARRHPEILVGIALDGPAGPAVLADVAAGRMASHRDVHTLADYFLLMCGWIYDINYAATVRELRRRGVLETMADLLGDQAEARAALARVLSERDRRAG